MFTYLVTDVFPFIGDFFSNLIAVSSLKPIALLNSISYQLQYPEGSPISLFLDGVNFWTGQNGFNDIYFYGLELSMGFLQTTWGRALGIVAYPVLSFFFAPCLNAPMWLALPICFTIYGLIFSMLKWVVDLIKDIVPI